MIKSEHLKYTIIKIRRKLGYAWIHQKQQSVHTKPQEQMRIPEKLERKTSVSEARLKIPHKIEVNLVNHWCNATDIFEKILSLSVFNTVFE